MSVLFVALCVWCTLLQEDSEGAIWDRAYGPKVLR